MRLSLLLLSCLSIHVAPGAQLARPLADLHKGAGPRVDLGTTPRSLTAVPGTNPSVLFVGDTKAGGRLFRIAPPAVASRLSVVPGIPLEDHVEDIDAPSLSDGTTVVSVRRGRPLHFDLYLVPPTGNARRVVAGGFGASFQVVKKGDAYLALNAHPWREELILYRIEKNGKTTKLFDRSIPPSRQSTLGQAESDDVYITIRGDLDTTVLRIDCRTGKVVAERTLPVVFTSVTTASDKLYAATGKTVTRTDATAAGTKSIPISSACELTSSGTDVYCCGQTSASTGRELCQIDSNDVVTTYDIEPGTASSSPTHVCVPTPTEVHCLATRSGKSTWVRVNPATKAVTAVIDPLRFTVSRLMVVGARVYGAATDTSGNSCLASWDGTTAKCVPFPADAYGGAVLGKETWFGCDTGTQYEPCAVDENDKVVCVDGYPPVDTTRASNAFRYEAAPDDHVYAIATDQVDFQEPWYVSLLTGSATKIDVNKNGPSIPAYQLTSGQTLLARLQTGQSKAGLGEIFGPTLLVLLSDIDPGATFTRVSSLQGPLFAGAGREGYVFRGFLPATGHELLFYDRKTRTVSLACDVRPGAAGSFPGEIVARDSDGKVVFTADDGTHGTELHVLDPSTGKCRLLRDIRSGAASSLPSSLVFAGDTLFFFATDATHGSELWKSDLTSAGTVLVKDLNPGGASGARFAMTAFGDRVLFRGGTAQTGLELAVSDGTAAGTKVVADLRPGTRGSNPISFTVAGPGVFFVADARETIGRELGYFDGSSARMLDIMPGRTASTPTSLAAVGDRIYFAATGPVIEGRGGRELWASDGTRAGTFMVQDILPGPRGGNPANMTLVNGKLVLTANNGVTGAEPMVIEHPGPSAQATGEPCGETAVPRLTATTPLLGEVTKLRGRFAPRGDLGVLLVGRRSRRAIPFGVGCHLYVDVGAFWIEHAFLGTGGPWTYDMGLPLVPELTGIEALVAQAFFVAFQPPHRMLASNGVLLRFGLR